MPAPTSTRTSSRCDARELVDTEGTWWADDRLFRFHHALIRDAAYRRVLKEVHADLHERYAEWLEGSGVSSAADQDETLGWHFEQAYQFRVELGGPHTEDTMRLAVRAASHLADAAKRALDRDDTASAASLLGHALPLDAAPPTPVGQPSYATTARR